MRRLTQLCLSFGVVLMFFPSPARHHFVFFSPLEIGFDFVLSERKGRNLTSGNFIIRHLHSSGCPIPNENKQQSGKGPLHREFYERSGLPPCFSGLSSLEIKSSDRRLARFSWGGRKKE